MPTPHEMLDTSPHTEQSTSDGLPIRERLDLLEELGDLKDTFRDDVVYHLVLWVHGTWSAYEGRETTRELVGYAARLAPHLLNAEIVGLESSIPSRRQFDPNRTNEEFARANARFKGGKDVRATDVQGVTLLMALGIVRGQRRLGRSTPPRFVPLDIYNNLEAVTAIEEQEAQERGQDYLTQQLAEGSLSRAREATVIRQLHELGQTMPEDGAIHEIADVHGAGHSSLAVALRCLGARVKVTYVDRMHVSASDYLERLLRYRTVGREQAQTLARHCEIADAFALNTWAEGIQEGLVTVTSYHVGNHIDTYAQLSMLSLRGLTGTLPDHLQHDWDRVMQGKPPRSEVEARRAWLHQVLTLAKTASAF